MTPSASRGHAGGAHGGSGSRRDLYLMEKMHPEEPTACVSPAGSAARAGRGNGQGAARKSRSPFSPPPPPEAAGAGEERREHPSKAGGAGSRSPPPPHGGDVAPAHGKVGWRGRVKRCRGCGLC